MKNIITLFVLILVTNNIFGQEFCDIYKKMIKCILRSDNIDTNMKKCFLFNELMPFNSSEIGFWFTDIIDEPPLKENDSIIKNDHFNIIDCHFGMIIIDAKEHDSIYYSEKDSLENNNTNFTLTLSKVLLINNKIAYAYAIEKRGPRRQDEILFCFKFIVSSKNSFKLKKVSRSSS